MRCHQLDYEIIGHDMQMVEVELDPGETVIAEAGAMTYMEEGIKFDTKMGDGSNADQGVISKLFSAGKRMLTGESVFITHFSNSGQAKSRVSFAAPFPGSIVAVDMATTGEELLCQKDSFLAAALGTKIDIAFNRRIGSGLLGGEGFILQRMQGDGMVFMHAGGTVIRKELNNQRLYLDTGCLVAFSPGIDYDIKMVSGLKSMFFGGEGMCLATLSGTGSVWVQSLPLSRMADRILAHMPKAGGSRQGES
jgi:uncharacterized protein (TIGR00266 family)